MKQHKAMIVALIVICITAVVAALVTRKDLCEDNPNWGGVIPATLQVLAYLQRTLVFTLACPRAGFWGG